MHLAEWLATSWLGPSKPALEDYVKLLQRYRTRLRPWCQEVENIRLQSLMFLVTVYALIGDDCRLSGTSKSADLMFNLMTIVAFALFLLEILATSIARDDYLLSLHCWMNLIATLSLLLDITWVFDWIVVTDQSNKNDYQAQTTGRGAGKMSWVGTRASSVMRLIRLIRLIRIVKIYKHSMDIWNSHQASQKAGQLGDSVGPGDATRAREGGHQESRVGMKLSRMTTYKVIILILFMLIVLPFIRVDNFYWSLATSSQYGADVMYRAWLSCDHGSNDLPCREFEQQLTMYMGYHLRQKATHCDKIFNEAFHDCRLDLGWIGTLQQNLTFNVYPNMSMLQMWNTLFRGTDYTTDALPPNLPSAIDDGDFSECEGGYYVSLFQKQTLACPEALRDQELKAIMPRMTSIDAEIDFVLIFDARPWVVRSAVFNIIQTLFICCILAIGALVFSHDANVLVLQPIERMIRKVEAIRDNPLYAMKVGDDAYELQQIAEGSPSDSRSTLQVPVQKWYTRFFQRRLAKQGKVELLETKILENAIIKLGKLLALGFGEAGSEIIGKNMDSDSTNVNALIPGQKVEAVFGVCDIRNFTETTEVLQDKVMVFVNQVSDIVHHTVNMWQGAANRNNGNAFLIVWRMRSHYSMELKTKVADMSVMSFVQCVAALHKSATLKDYREHPALLARLPDYRVRMGFGLHYGWAIEGAIGSEFKIDASYLSPHVNMASRLEKMTKRYQVSIMISGPLQMLCSPEMSEHFRGIDHVKLRGVTADSFRLFTVDVRGDVLDVDDCLPRRQRNSYEVRMKREHAKNEKMLSSFKVYEAFAADEDIREMRSRFPAGFFQNFNKGYVNYEAGEWDVAKSVFLKTMTMLEEVDGPSKALLDFMASYDFNSTNVTPKGWLGWRLLADS